MASKGTAQPPNPTSVYWLIETARPGWPGVFTVRVDAEREALPVFSFPDEAEMFLRLNGLGEEGWRIASSTAAELVGRLAGYHRAGIEFVALDPLSEMLGSRFDTTIALVTLSFSGFVERHSTTAKDELDADGAVNARLQNGVRRVSVKPSR